MKHLKKPKLKVVAASCGEEFEERCNEVMDELTKKGIVPRVEFPNALFTAYITYEETVAIPETCEDELELRGIRYTCGDCPKYEPPEDRRTKYTRCIYSPYRVSREAAACEFFCKQVMQGRWIPQGEK